MSLQLQNYLRLRAAGSTMHSAAAEAGLGIAEARLTENDIAKGELKLPDLSTIPAADAAPPEEETVMVSAAKKQDDEVEEVQKPDFERAAKILRGDVKPAEEQNAKSRGDLSAAWKAIETDCHVNKKAAKDAYRLLGMSPELRDDYLRSLYGMMGELNIGISSDLVDQMGDGEAPTMPVVERSRPELVTV